MARPRKFLSDLAIRQNYQNPTFVRLTTFQLSHLSFEFGLDSLVRIYFADTIDSSEMDILHPSSF